MTPKGLERSRPVLILSKKTTLLILQQEVFRSYCEYPQLRVKSQQYLETEKPTSFNVNFSFHFLNTCSFFNFT